MMIAAEWGVGQVLWSMLIIFLPFIGIFAYLIARGGSMAAEYATTKAKVIS